MHVFAITGKSSYHLLSLSPSHFFSNKYHPRCKAMKKITTDGLYGPLFQWATKINKKE